MKKLKKLPFKYILYFIIPAFSFLLGCMVMINLVPINKTCIVDNTDREYNIMKNAKLKPPELIILILSAPKNFDKRNTIRNTWLLLQERTKTIMRHYFVTGSLGLTADDILYLSSEQSQLNDLLILPMYDSYDNLTHKVLSSFIWLKDQLELGLNFKYVLKCDDDSFVWIDSLIYELHQIEVKYLNLQPGNNIIEDNTSSPHLRMNIQTDERKTATSLELYWGYFNGKAQVKSSGKWKDNNWILCDYYLPYALGGGYVLSKGLIVYLANNADYLRYYKSEDVSIGTWLSSFNDVLRIHDRRFDTEWISRGCQNYHLVSHHLAKQEMHTFYSNILKKGNLCDIEISKRGYYLYDWNSVPSKCCNKKV